MLEDLKNINGTPPYAFEDYNTMLKLQCKSNTDELNTYLIDLHALSMDVEGWDLGEDWSGGVINLRSTGLFVFFFTLVFGCAARRHKTCIMYSHFKLSRPVIRHQSILVNSDSHSFLIHLALFLSTERYTSDRIKFMSSFGSSVSHWLQIVFIPLVPSL